MLKIALAVILLGATQVPPTHQEADKQSLSCTAGPVKRQFGGTNWLVYGCNDGQSMVIVSDAGNPASPFYFVLQKKGDAYDIHGEGNGSEAASSAAGDAIARLTKTELDQLLAMTKG